MEKLFAQLEALKAVSHTAEGDYMCRIHLQLVEELIELLESMVNENPSVSGGHE